MMAAAQAGDRASYRLLLTSSRTWLARYYSSRTAPQMIDDLVQETLLSVHSKRATYDPARSFYPWLAAIARYRWIDWLRKTVRTEELADDMVSVESGEEAILSKLSLETLLSRIPPAQASAILWTRINGRSIRETAAITGQSESLVKVNVHRGLHKLAALVESE